MRTLARKLRKAADLMDVQDAWEARRLGVPLNLYRFFQRVNVIAPIQTILDIGANRGDFSRFCAVSFPDATIHAFEPLTECRPVLKELAGKYQQIHLHPVALGETAGEVEMFENAYNPSSSILPMLDRHRELWPKTAWDKKIRVTMETLDHFVKNLDLKPPLFIKIDVQGYEMHVLSGAKRVLQNTSVIMTEVLFEPLYKDQADFIEIVNFLGGQGFRFTEFVDERRLPPYDTLAYADAAFVKMPDRRL